MNKEHALAEITVLFLTAVGEKGIPSGELYAHLCAKLSLDNYNKVITALKNAGLISESAHYLRLTDDGKTLLKMVNPPT